MPHRSTSLIIKDMSSMEELFNLVGSFICHQLPSRTLYVGNMALPVCARDTGIYAGIFTSALFLLLFRRLKAQRPPGTMVSIFMCAFMLPMVIDGLLSYLGIIESNNITRLLTGVLFGLPIPFFLVPAAHFSIRGANNKAVLENIAELLFTYAAAIILCLLLLLGLVPYAAAGLIFISGFLFLLSRISYTVLARFGRFRRKALYTVTCCATLCILTILYFISTYLLQPLKAVLLGG